MFIEESKENKVVEQQFVEAQIVQMNARKENVVEVEVHPSIEMQVMAKTQQRAMEIKKRESEAIAKRRYAILDRATLLEKGIKISNHE